MHVFDAHLIAFLAGMVSMAIIYFTTRRHYIPPYQ